MDQLNKKFIKSPFFIFFIHIQIPYIKNVDFDNLSAVLIEFLVMIWISTTNLDQIFRLKADLIIT